MACASLNPASADAREGMKPETVLFDTVSEAEESADIDIVLCDTSGAHRAQSLLLLVLGRGPFRNALGGSFCRRPSSQQLQAHGGAQALQGSCSESEQRCA